MKTNKKEKLQNATGFAFDDGFHDQLPTAIQPICLDPAAVSSPDTPLRLPPLAPPQRSEAPAQHSAAEAEPHPASTLSSGALFHNALTPGWHPELWVVGHHCAKVLQAFISPVLNPFWNQSIRCCEVP
jgi:hypothetical protein